MVCEVVCDCGVKGSLPQVSDACVHNDTIAAAKHNFPKILKIY